MVCDLEDNMNIVVAIDSFKGCLTSLEAGKAAGAGVSAVFPGADVKVMPLADGGEGTVEALTLGMGGALNNLEVTGPMKKKVKAQYGILPDGKTAIVEMSSAAGITLVPQEERNPLHATTYGVGEILLDAIRKGCRHFIVGIGGSATNDGGVGMLQALGFDMQDGQEKQVPLGAVGLKELASIEDKNALPELRECTFRVACDVANPLCGREGCSAVFAPQKGAGLSEIRDMDEWMKHYAEISNLKYPHADPEYPGAGAAGGMGFAFMTYMGARLESGIGIVLAETKLEKYIARADLVITGEGRLDGQTIMGKAPIGVARLAKKYGKPVIAFCGSATSEAMACNEHGIDAYFPILRQPATLAEAMDREMARQNMIDTVAQVMRAIRIKVPSCTADT